MNTDMAQMALFDYSVLDDDTRSFVEARTTEIKVLVKRSGEDIVTIGQKLAEVKGRLGHGHFGDWLEAEFGWSQYTAINFMRVWSKFGNFPNLDSFAPSALYLLAAPSTPEEAIAEVLERAENGESITHALVKRILDFAKSIRGKKTQQRRTERKERNQNLCSEPTPIEALDHKFDLVYADPPWRYEFSKTDSREIENQYPTMALEDICALPVGDIVIRDAVLFLWATIPKLEEALRVLNEWGFSYRTAIVWDKVRMGQGIYTRQQVELLLIGIKGEMYSPESDFVKDFRSLVRIERSNKHSEKPEEFYSIIEQMYPDCTKVELFARNQRDGWAAWGNQADGEDA